MTVNTTVRSYREVSEWCDKARFPDKGRVTSQYRVIKRGDNYVVHLICGGARLVEIGYFSPNESFTFTASASTLLSNSPRVAFTFGNTFGVLVKTKQSLVRAGHWRGHRWYPYTQGMVFDLNSGAVWNNVNAQENTAVKSVWRKAMRKFNHGLRFRSRMGVFDGLVTRMAPDMKLFYGVHWSGQSELALVANCVIKQDFSTELMQMFVADYLRFHRIFTPSGEGAALHAFHIMQRMSPALRQYYAEHLT